MPRKIVIYVCLPGPQCFTPVVTPSQIALKQKNELNLFGRISKELYKSDSRDKSNDIYIPT